MRISQRGIEKCLEPTVLIGNETSCLITQGALGNTYFVNALRCMEPIAKNFRPILLNSPQLVLACDPKYINRLFVSTKYAHMGLYTIKIAKQGRV